MPILPDYLFNPDKKSITSRLLFSFRTDISKAIRLICYSYDRITKDILVRVYYDEQPSEDEEQLISIILTEFTSYFNYSCFNETYCECVYSDKPLHDLEKLEGVVYMRKEGLHNGRWVAE